MKGRSLLFVGILTVLLMGTVGSIGTTLEPVGLQIDMGVVAEYTPHSPILIQHDNFTGWPGSGTPEDPYRIEGLNISADAVCIGVFNTSSYYVIKDCFIRYTGGAIVPPISLYMSNNSRVENCYVQTHWNSITVEFSHNSNITGNVIVGTVYTRDCPSVRLTDNIISSESTNATKGIRITSGCDNAVIYNNTVDLSGLTGSSVMGMEIFESENLTVQSNLVKNVDRSGVVFLECPRSIISDNTFWKCYVGIRIDLSDFTTVERNVAYEGENGILLNSNNCTAINNSAFRNTGVGITAGMHNCTIYNNFLGFNTHEWGQAYEVQAANYWDDGVSLGNYWSDYDGISDNYTINGNQGGMDHYPMVFEESVIDSPTDVEFESGDAGHELSWTSSGTLPTSYDLMRDDEVVESDTWDGSELTFSLDGLPVGIFHYKLTTRFESRMDVSDEVTVTVVAASGPSIDVDEVTGVTPHVVVEVSATVTDVSGVSEVILSYTTDEAMWTNITMTLSSGQWVAEIPAHPEGTVVGYKVYAQDMLGNWAVSTAQSFTVSPDTTPDPMILYLIAGAGILVVIGIAVGMMKRR